MSLIETLVQVPYLMRPGIQRLNLDKDPYTLTPETEPAKLRKIARMDAPTRYLSLDPNLPGQVFEHLCGVTNGLIGARDLTQLVHNVREDVAVMNSAGLFELVYMNHPSSFAPEELVGKTFAEIHMRVPDASLIQKSSDSLVKLITSDQALRRTVWTLSPTDDLCRHPALKASQTSWDKASRVYLRWEEQTFLPFVPDERVIFLNKIQTKELSTACESYDDIVRVQASLETMTDAVKAYKGLDHPRIFELVRAVMDGKFAGGI
jgi:hypothetical protein